MLEVRRTLLGLRRSAVLASVIVGLLSQGLLFVSGPLFARALGVEGRGQLALCVLVLALATQIGGLGLPIAVTRHLASNDDTAGAAAALWRKRYAWLATAFAVGLLASVVTTAIVWSGRLPPGPLVPVLVGLATMAAMTQAMAQAVTAGAGRFRALNGIRLLPAGGGCLAAVAAVAAGYGTVSPVLALYALALTAVALASAVVVRSGVRAGSAKPTRVPIRNLYGFGVLALLGAANPADALGIDQIAVAVLLSEEALGIYVVAAAFANLSNLLLSSIGLIGSPRVAASGGGHAARALTQRYLLAGATLGIVQTAAVVALIPLVLPLLYDEAFEASVRPAQYLAASGLLVGLRRLSVMLAQGAGHPGMASLAELLSVVCLALLLPALIPAFGLVGAAVAVGCSSAAGASACFLRLEVVLRRSHAENR